VNKKGAPVKRDWIRNEKVYTNDGTKTKWTFLKYIESNFGKRRMLLRCECGNVRSNYVSDVTNGRASQCIKCSNRIKNRVTYTNTKKQASLDIGKNMNYFTNMYGRYKKRYLHIMALGYGDLVLGWKKEQDEKKTMDTKKQRNNVKRK
jgi:hypothetical protein